MFRVAALDGGFDAYLAFNTPEVSALIVRCQAGELQAFDSLVARYQRYVFNLIYQHLGNVDELEDVAQDIFLRIYKFIRKYRGNASLESWIYKIVLNFCRTHARRKAVLSRFFIQPTMQDAEDKSFSIFDNLADTLNDPAQQIESKTLAHDIISAVRQLPPIYRDILIMREVNELSYEEIAEVLGISIGTVKSRISRARDLVRQKVQL
jgi:RNA polymerase sigma-70 factor (ECF subfamily)